MRNQKLATVVLAASLAAVISIGGAMAYFTDVQENTNTFTVGKIEIGLDETEWDNWNKTNPDSIVPDQEIPKDPVITNKGDNDAFVFAKVKVPTANIIAAGEDGARKALAETQLFSYTVNSDWTLVTSNVVNGAAISVQNKTGAYGVHDAVSNGTGYVTYVYAYTGSDTSTMQRLSAGSSTSKVFPAVQFVNAVEDQGLEQANPQITVTAYAIQADFIQDGDTSVDGNNSGTPKTSPAAVWQILEKQYSAS